ncbi:MAG: AAA family ATPase [Alphaproteobacteria bacterium]
MQRSLEKEIPMYKIASVNIDGFWYQFSAKCKFSSEVNIIIGKNGTGKTTFMNILHAILSVDVDEIVNSEFNSATIHLTFQNKNKTVKAKKVDPERFPYTSIEYQISQKKYRIRAISTRERNIPHQIRRRLLGEASEVKDALADVVALSSLSVYRLRNSDEYEITDRHGSRVISPVDYRLSEALAGLTKYQLDLSLKSREISAKLQKDVLASILYEEEDGPRYRSRDLEFNEEEEKSNLISAYTQLNAIDAHIRRKIDTHVKAIAGTFKSIERQSEIDKNNPKIRTYPLAVIEARRKTTKIIALSLASEQNSKQLFSQIDLFIDTLRTFISNKSFQFESGNLIISNKQGQISHSRLSSGEKQLLILLTEALLQNQKPHVFLADEPELSLHIEWQRMVIPAVRKLNPEAQIIVATHFTRGCIEIQVLPH